MKVLRVIKIKCYHCKKDCEAINIHNVFENKLLDKIKGVQCFNCGYFEILSLEEENFKLF